MWPATELVAKIILNADRVAPEKLVPHQPAASTMRQAPAESQRMTPIQFPRTRFPSATRLTLCIKRSPLTGKFLQND